jgi:hypothetical protein
MQYKERLTDPFLAKYRELLTEQNVCSDKIEEMLSEKEQQITQQGYLAIPTILAPLTDYCTLRCKHCIEMNPYLKTRSHVPLEEAVESIDRFLGAVDECLILEITNGDVFLYPYIKEFLRRYCDNEKITQIKMVTCGIIQPDEELTELLCHKKVHIVITAYGIKISKVAMFIELMEEKNISFHVHEYGKWCDFKKYPRYGLTTDEMKQAYEQCPIQDFCKILLPAKGGIFTPCKAAAVLIQHDYLSDDELETTRLTDYESPAALKEAIRGQYLIEYTKACDYCAFASDNPHTLERGEQVEGGLKQSAYTIVKREYLQSKIEDLFASWEREKYYKNQAEILANKEMKTNRIVRLNRTPVSESGKQGKYGVEYTMKLEGDRLILDLQCDYPMDKLHFAFYLYRERKIAEKVWYQNKASYEWRLGVTGFYMVEIFIKQRKESTDNNEVIETETLLYDFGD